MQNSNSDHRVIVWVEASHWALQRSQSAAAQRLLLMVVWDASHAGFERVAAAAQDVLVGLNPRHPIGAFAGPGVALRDPDFRQFVSTVQRSLSFEDVERMIGSRPADDRLALDDSAPLPDQLTSWLQAAAQDEPN